MFGGPGFGWGIWHALQAVFMAIGGFLLLVIFLGLAVLMVRFLLVAPAASAPAEPVEPVGPVGAPEPPPKPAPRPRTPKAPPAP